MKAVDIMLTEAAEAAGEAAVWSPPRVGDCGRAPVLFQAADKHEMPEQNRESEVAAT